MRTRCDLPDPKQPLTQTVDSLGSAHITQLCMPASLGVGSDMFHSPKEAGTLLCRYLPASYEETID